MYMHMLYASRLHDDPVVAWLQARASHPCCVAASPCLAPQCVWLQPVFPFILARFVMTAQGSHDFEPASPSPNTSEAGLSETARPAHSTVVQVPVAFLRDFMNLSAANVTKVMERALSHADQATAVDTYFFIDNFQVHTTSAGSYRLEIGIERVDAWTWKLVGEESIIGC